MVRGSKLFYVCTTLEAKRNFKVSQWQRLNEFEFVSSCANGILGRGKEMIARLELKTTTASRLTTEEVGWALTITINRKPSAVNILKFELEFISECYIDSTTQWKHGLTCRPKSLRPGLRRVVSVRRLREHDGHGEASLVQRTTAASGSHDAALLGALGTGSEFIRRHNCNIILLAINRKH